MKLATWGDYIAPLRGDVATLGENGCMSEKQPIEYLSTAEFAERIGVARGTLSRYVLPTPDALTGGIRGWLPETVDAWNSARPGRGRWGERPKVAELGE